MLVKVQVRNGIKKGSVVAQAAPSVVSEHEKVLSGSYVRKLNERIS